MRARAVRPPASRLAAAAALLAALAAGCERSSAGGVTSAMHGVATPVTDPDVPERAYSTQLHVHGSFSEGQGSIDSHTHEARDVGADVIWWSDHDFRIASYRHVSRFGFESWQEPLDRGEPWQEHRTGRKAKRGRKGVKRNAVGSAPTGSAEITGTRADEGRASLHVTATSPAARFEARRHELEAQRGLFKRPLAAGVTLALSVFPEQVGRDAHAIVDVRLSEHAPRAGVALGQSLGLRYVLDNEARGPERSGPVVRVPVRYREGEWNRLELEITRDAIRSFPEIRGDDNLLARIALGVEARNGATGSVFFDRLIVEQETTGNATFARQRALIDAIAGRHGDLRQLQGVELSYIGPHLNEFSVDTTLIDYDPIVAELAHEGVGTRASRIADFARRTIEAVHARGGLVSYNHMFGTKFGPGHLAHDHDDEGRGRRHWSKEEILDTLTHNRVLGADLLEVGYRDRGGHSLEDHLWVWDRLAARGLHLVGIGVSDSHGGESGRWRTSDDNFLSWIYARSPEKADLIEGLRAGRVFFGDIVLFDGTLDLTTASGRRMGQIVVTDAPTADVTVRIAGAAEGDSVRLLVSGEEVDRSTTPGGTFEQMQRVTLGRDEPAVVRAEVYGADGRAKVLSNPVTFVREVPEGGVDAARVAFDVGPFASRTVERFRLTALDAPSSGEVRIRGRGTKGRIDVECVGCTGAPSFELDGLAAVARVDGTRLHLEEVDGEGAITLRVAR